MLVKARKLVDEEVQAAPGLGGGWAGEQSGAAAGVGVGAIPYGGGMGEGGAKRMGAESKDGNTKNAATGMGMKEGRRVYICEPHPQQHSAGAGSIIWWCD